MPSPKNYKRDYDQERATSLARGEGPDNAARKRARRAMEAQGKVKPFDGKDVDHVKPLAKGGPVNNPKLRVKPASENRSFPRTKNAGMK